MKTFTSSNGLKMVEGKLFNWRVEPVYYGQEEPFGYLIHMGGMAQMFQALYMPDEKILSLCDTAYSSDEVFRFSCDDIEAAEPIVDAFIKANKFEMEETIFYIKSE